MSAARPVRGICFDKDGTLFDFAATWEAWAVAFLTRAAEGDPQRAAAAGCRIGFDFAARRFDRDSIAIAGTSGEVGAALAPAFAHMSQAEVIAMLNDEAARAPQVEAVPLAPLLTVLRGRGLKLGVATNDSETPARAHLDAADVTHHFDFIAGYDSGHGGKPAPGQLLAFARATGIDAAHTVMVGDSRHDLDAGRAAGMRTVGVLTGGADEATLAPLADVVLPDIGGLPAWLDTL